MTKPALVESPKSEFVREMEAAIQRRLAAPTRAGKTAVDREIAGIVKQYLGRDAWQAMVDADRETASVPRGTSRDLSRRRSRARVGAGGERRYSEEFDHKRAQAGDSSDD
jgi:hypothetical protein